ncbi:MAG: M48 family metallopeptidase [Candidatus Aminicenantales bacterium]
MYEQIARNKRKSFGLIVFFALLIFLLAWVLEDKAGWGKEGLFLAGLIAVVSTWGSYYWSDRLVLAISRAKPVEKQEYPYLYNTVEGLALAAGLPPPRCYLVDDGAPNAFATGRCPRQAVIVVTRGLLEKLNRLELEGVIAHEMAHIKNYDILIQTLTVAMVGIVVLLSDWQRRFFYWGGSHSKRRERREGQTKALFALLGLVLALLSPLIAQLLRLAVSRRREFLADAEAALLTRYPLGLASALRKIAADPERLEVANKATAHLYIVNPLRNIGGSLNRLFQTHPPVEERIAALEKMAAGA